MTPEERLMLKKALEKEQDAAVRIALRRRQSIVIEQTADALDEVRYAGERELALADLSRHSDQIRQIRAALARLEAGTYGVCQHCWKPIHPKRLTAVPWTPLCLRCQELADEGEREGIHSPDEMRATAA